MITDCIDKQTVQLKIGNELTIDRALASVLRVNANILEVRFIIPAMQDCTINVLLVGGDGTVTDISYIDCGKLVVPTSMQICVIDYL